MAQDSIIQQLYGGHLEVLRVNHHGSSHSTNQAFVNAFSPQVSIFSVGDNNSFGHVNPDVLNRVLAETIGDNAGYVFLTESGAGVSSASDACYAPDERSEGLPEPPQPLEWCAQVVDGEFPTSTESNESGDDSVVIVVSSDGNSFTVQGDEDVPAVTVQATGAGQ